MRAPIGSGRRVHLACGSGKAGGELSGGREFGPGHFVTRVGGGENEPHERRRVIVARDHPEGRDARERKIRVIRIRHQGAHAAKTMTVCIRRARQPP
jgi:hypothetical protein